MKSLTFFYSVILVVLPAFAEVTPSTDTPLNPATVTAPNWSAAMQKFTKDGVDSSQDAVDARLLIDHLSENDPVAKSAAAAAAPLAGASGAQARNAQLKGASAGANDFDPEKIGKDEDWSTTVRHTVRDIIKPYQEYLPSFPDNSPQALGERQTAGEPGLGGPAILGGQKYARKSETQRRAENIQSEQLVAQLIDDIWPWAIGALLVGLIAYGISKWVGYVKRKPSVQIPSLKHAHTSKKHHRRSP
jgi:hypothetical protein